QIANDGTTDQLTAGGAVTLTAADGDTPGFETDVVVDGRVTSTGGSITARATRDVLIAVGSPVGTDARLDAGTFVTLTGDFDQDDIGGVHVATRGLIQAGTNATLTGSDLASTAAVIDGVRIDADGIANQIAAGNDITITARNTADLAFATDVVLDGRIRSTGGDVTIDATREILFSSRVLADTGNVRFVAATELTADASVAATVGDIDFDSTIDGAFDLDLDAGDFVTLDGAIGSTTRLTRIDVSGDGGIDVLGASVATDGDQTWTSTGGNIRISRLDAGVDDLTITADGNITDGNGDADAANGLNLVARSATLTAGGTIGSPAAGAPAVNAQLESRIDRLEITAASGGVRDFTGDLALFGNSAVTGTVRLLALGGNLTNENNAQVDFGTAILQAAGDLFLGNRAGDAVTIDRLQIDGGTDVSLQLNAGTELADITLSNGTFFLQTTAGNVVQAAGGSIDVGAAGAIGVVAAGAAHLTDIDRAATVSVQAGAALAPTTPLELPTVNGFGANLVLPGANATHAVIVIHDGALTINTVANPDGAASVTSVAGINGNGRVYLKSGGPSVAAAGNPAHDLTIAQNVFGRENVTVIAADDLTLVPGRAIVRFGGAVGRVQNADTTFAKNDGFVGQTTGLIPQFGGAQNIEFTPGAAGELGFTAIATFADDLQVTLGNLNGGVTQLIGRNWSAAQLAAVVNAQNGDPDPSLLGTSLRVFNDPFINLFEANGTLDQSIDANNLNFQDQEILNVRTGSQGVSLPSPAREREEQILVERVEEEAVPPPAPIDAPLPFDRLRSIPIEDQPFISVLFNASGDRDMARDLQREFIGSQWSIDLVRETIINEDFDPGVYWLRAVVPGQEPGPEVRVEKLSIDDSRFVPSIEAFVAAAEASREPQSIESLRSEAEANADRAAEKASPESLWLERWIAANPDLVAAAESLPHAISANASDMISSDGMKLLPTSESTGSTPIEPSHEGSIDSRSSASGTSDDRPTIGSTPQPLRDAELEVESSEATDSGALTAIGVATGAVGGLLLLTRRERSEGIVAGITETEASTAADADANPFSKAARRRRRLFSKS
ncbi:MAG TPA: hypothetical protein DCQ98_18300, partial [Planctomycetaceae bacterium]|nr:hypothetical protein [Planctomycetaceae bacterium]